jgi:type I restriction-modification system DNA methylase subunit
MKDAARRKIEELIERFSRNSDVYKSGSYNEAQTRREFIEPFFEALGWDVYNRAGYAEQYKDVVHEDSVKVGVSLKAPDYSFRIGGQRKFFLEAKKPSVSIKSDIDPSYQLRRYAWSAKLPLSILTDFEELAVYDCRIKPSPRDKVGTGRIAYYTYNRYIDEFDAIYDVFSRDAVLKGSFDRYAVTTAGKRGTAEVDREFLKEIEGWRDSLARNIAIRNSKLTVDEMNFAVQQTIDRIIFLRICEDRGIEQYGGLQALLNGVNTYRRLFELFYQADTKYNSGLFDFSTDKLTPDIKIDDDVLKGIIDSLYYPKSPYEFSVLGVDILGNVYEQFLGKVIRLTAGHNAKVKEKPEVKKAGGVYYTPEYIVEYIVQNTVGKLIEGKTPKKAEELKILDPACGSGSFLIGAYQHLLNYHLKWYIENSPEKYAKGKFPAVYRSGEGWRLTTQEKKRILLNNIFGVDIDRQAVEVTKLSLLLKVLEDENRETIGKNLLLFRERVLPNLDNNIKCGNSLIGTDFYSNSLPLIGEDENLKKTNPFDWHDPEKGFGKIIPPPHSPLYKGGNKGGFDAVIGNPPYGAELTPQIKEYFAQKYIHQNYQYDSYLLFMEKTIGLLRENGFWGMIIPNTWLTNLLFKNIRRFMVEQTSIKNIVHFFNKVFAKATVDTEIVITQKAIPKNNKCEITIFDKGEAASENYIAQKKWQSKHGEVINIFIDNETETIINKIAMVSKPLASLCDVTVGIKPYQKGKGKPAQTEKIVKDRIYDATYKKGNTYRKYLRGKDINRYTIKPIEERWISYGEWLAEPRYTANFDAKEKILIRQTGDRPIAVIDFEQYLCLNNLHVITPIHDKYTLKYILACINSRLLDFFYETLNPEKGEALAEVKKENVEKLPIRTIDFNNKKEKAMHYQIVSMVDMMLDLHEKLKKTKTPHDRELIERQIKATDSQIDKLVYELYGLTEEEIRVVEESL